ncbi:phage protein Gp36 family protein [Niabella insulamsoli]|uniref:phage protein Gp36 family protein n=1 Tax=Niabella insulamsoli TaxID=3144874 RepID=UPI0031FC648C
MYLKKSDYQIRIRINLLDLILENIAVNSENNPTADEILAAADKIACDTIATKAGVLYNVEPEFEKVGDARNGYLLALGLSIGLYELYQRTDDYEVPEKVIKNYNDAFKSLDEISRGKEPLNLPPKEQEGDSNQPGEEDAETSGFGLRRIGSAPKRSHRI